MLPFLKNWVRKVSERGSSEAAVSRHDEARRGLSEFIRDRLWDSFDVDGEGHRLGYSSPHYPNGDEGVIQAVGLTRGRSWIAHREAWPQIQQNIDGGNLSPVGLIQTEIPGFLIQLILGN